MSQLNSTNFIDDLFKSIGSKSQTEKCLKETATV